MPRKSLPAISHITRDFSLDSLTVLNFPVNASKILILAQPPATQIRGSPVLESLLQATLLFRASFQLSICRGFFPLEVIPLTSSSLMHNMTSVALSFLADALQINVYILKSEPKIRRRGQGFDHVTCLDDCKNRITGRH